MSGIKRPQIADDVFVAQGAVVRGDVKIGHRSSVWFNTVIRSEADVIEIGEDTNIQDNCVLHADEGAPIIIGNQVTIGHGAIVHGCTIADNNLIGMGAIILNNAVIGKNCIIGAGALVTQNAVIPDNSLVVGSPAKVKRTLTEEEIADITYNAVYNAKEAEEYRNGIF